MTGARKTPRPPYRKLRVFASDPGLQTDPEKAPLHSVEVEIPWEDLPREQDDTSPNAEDAFQEDPYRSEEPEDGPDVGPVGDYLEVVDFDPASGCFYEPVNLNDPHLLEQHGLAPSEGNPQFHQQMVYAVAMKTIKIFEKALGRQVLWAPNVPGHYSGPKRKEYVRRLRIYPHAFREANAYYSPDKKALLFGYFPATGEPSGKHMPGGLVFTCLSQDIIVHELSHAILDGMHRRFIENSNIDVLAFHEAFADIVALFQHFTYPEIVQHEIAQTRGRFHTHNLLADLAKQFGLAIGRSKALRTAIGEPKTLEGATECHERGSVLVAAVFDAFLSIYNTRTKDLIRLATGGTGLLEEGAELHPDLVNRLAKEASKSASHILTICIRALDYLPPVDVCFGDYLRALITADTDLVPDDALGYRVAIIEAFRKRGIYPRGVRTLSEDALIWDGPDKDETLARRRFTFVNRLKRDFPNWDLTIRRNIMHAQIKKAREDTHAVFRNSWNIKGQVLQKKGLYMPYDMLNERGLFEIHSIRPVRRIGPDGQLLSDLLVEVTQKRCGYLDQPLVEDQHLTKEQREQASIKPHFWFRGGCTILINMKTAEVRYCIYKDINSKGRYKRQQEYLKDKWGFSEETPILAEQIPMVSEEETFALLHKEEKEEDTQWARK